MDLNSKISDLPRVGSFLSNKFKKLNIHTIEELLYHVPSHYLDYSQIKKIKDLKVDEVVTIHAKIVSITNVVSKRGLKMQIGSVEDSTGKLMVVWFNQQYLTRTLFPGKLVSLSGKVGFFNRKICMSSPDFEILDSDESPTVHTGRLLPIYPETAGLSSKWIRRIVLSTQYLVLSDFLGENILKKYKLVDYKTAVKYVHFPTTLEEAEIGRKRLAFNELLKLEIQSEIRKIHWQKNKLKSKLSINHSAIQPFINSLPFKLTNSQQKAIDEIISDMNRDIPMNRLLEGDVGSGKTAVAAAGIYACLINKRKSIIMAPTQILAEQHYKTLSQLLSKSVIQLVTAQTKQKDIKNADVYVGTHALLHKIIDFSEVSYVVIDEQHRFGVEQRNHLANLKNTPHVLTMTATPIPRTVALTTYGDLDLSVLTEYPKGRQKITTWVVPEEKRKGAYEWTKKQMIDDKCQMFIVCPLISDSDFETMKDVKSVTTEFEKLKIIYKDFKLGLLHGKMKATEKNEILSSFKDKKLDILVSTPVIEVGIDIPNATIMIIEASERFGLAQLHQLRGRVGRGEKKSHCLLFSNIKYSRRLKAMEKMHSGFELAELDLKLRGPGEVFGTAQSGFPELKVASWNNYELIHDAKEVAKELISKKDFPIEKWTIKTV